MENIWGLLRIRVIRGINLAKRDARGSDPYVLIKLGKQKVKTSVVKKNVNPEWDEELTLLIADIPNIPIILKVYDKDTFTLDDKMGVAEFDIRQFLEVIKMHLENVVNGTVITTMKPNRENCLAEESHVVWENGQLVQHMFLRLRNVECGEIELKLHWIDGPGSKNV